MAGTEHARRRFITRADVEDAAAAGRSIQVRGRDVLTDEAAQRAMDLGVAVERESASRGRSSSGGASSPAASAGAGSAGAASAGAGSAGGGSAGASSRGSSPAAGSVSPEDLRRAVRAAVVAELGSEPPGLDAAIERVLQRRSR
jgi:hypothetical protein